MTHPTYLKIGKRLIEGDYDFKAVNGDFGHFHDRYRFKTGWFNWVSFRVHYYYVGGYGFKIQIVEAHVKDGFFSFEERLPLIDIPKEITNVLTQITHDRLLKEQADFKAREIKRINDALNKL